MFKKIKAVTAMLLCVLISVSCITIPAFAEVNYSYSLTEGTELERVSDTALAPARKVFSSLFRIITDIFLFFGSYASSGVSKTSQALESILDVAMSSKFSTIGEVFDNINNQGEKNADAIIASANSYLFNFEIYNYSYTFANGAKKRIQLAVYNDKGTYDSDDKIVLYYHGGAYVDEALLFHYWFGMRLAEELDCTVIMPMILTAPLYTYKESYELSIGLYKELLKAVPSEQYSFMGDSSGGAYAISMGLQCRDAGLSLPGSIFSFSPWLYLYNNTEEMTELEQANVDPMLVRYGIVLKGLCFAGMKDEVYACTGKSDAWALEDDFNAKFSDGNGGYTADYYYLNPGLADCAGLPPIYIFTGTHEILLADSHRFTESVEAKYGADSVITAYLAEPEKNEPPVDSAMVYYYECKYMNHTFALYPIPESQKVVKIIGEAII